MIMWLQKTMPLYLQAHGLLLHEHFEILVLLACELASLYLLTVATSYLVQIKKVQVHNNIQQKILAGIMLEALTHIFPQVK